MPGQRRGEAVGHVHTGVLLTWRAGKHIRFPSRTLSQMIADEGIKVLAQHLRGGHFDAPVGEAGTGKRNGGQIRSGAQGLAPRQTIVY